MEMRVSAVVPEVVILRLPQYMRALKRLLEAGVEVVSSQQLGNQLQMTPAQIRKDLSYFGRFGRQGRGYNIRYLLGELRQIMGLDRQWNVALIGVGRLGRAIISYPGFAPEGFHIVGAFDADPRQEGQEVGELVIQNVSALKKVIRREDVQIAIVAVPASHAQEVIDKLVQIGIKAILNYAPMSPQVPDDVKVRSVDPALALQTMTYYLRTLGSLPTAQKTA